MIKPILITAGLLTATAAFAEQNYVQDPQLSTYRSHEGNSDFWISHEDSKNGLGDVGSSGTSVSKVKGSARMRFKENVSNNDFTAKPGLSQIVTGFPANTEMSYSLFYCDKKGTNSPSTLYYGVRQVVEGAALTGNVIAENRVHVKDLRDAPKAGCFRQVSVDFNSGNYGKVEIFSLMEVDTGESGQPDMTKDIEVRVDEFSVLAK